MAFHEAAAIEHSRAFRRRVGDVQDATELVAHVDALGVDHEGIDEQHRTRFGLDLNTGREVATRIRRVEVALDELAGVRLLEVVPRLAFTVRPGHDDRASIGFRHPRQQEEAVEVLRSHGTLGPLAVPVIVDRSVGTACEVALVGHVDDQLTVLDLRFAEVAARIREKAFVHRNFLDRAADGVQRTYVPEWPARLERNVAAEFAELVHLPLKRQRVVAQSRDGLRVQKVGDHGVSRATKRVDVASPLLLAAHSRRHSTLARLQGRASLSSPWSPTRMVSSLPLAWQDLPSSRPRF